MSGKDPVGEMGAWMFFALVVPFGFLGIGAMMAGQLELGIGVFMALDFQFWIIS